MRNKMLMKEADMDQDDSSNFNLTGGGQKILKKKWAIIQTVA